jgi:hypothetical protein
MLIPVALTMVIQNEITFDFSFYKLIKLFLVYFVNEKGWTHVWAGDTTDMYYEYYPIERKLIKNQPQESELEKI